MMAVQLDADRYTMTEPDGIVTLFTRITDPDPPMCDVGSLEHGPATWLGVDATPKTVVLPDNDRPWTPYPICDRCLEEYVVMLGGECGCTWSPA